MLLSTVILAFASLASAHFSIEYPEERGDSFAPGASQWIYPCAGVNQTAATNRTLWPLTGGSLSLHLSHKWTYFFVNLGLGTNYPSFNISLTPSLTNSTGNGTLCIPAFPLPSGLSIPDGTNASIQVVTVGESGSALYNCADITFTANAPLLAADACVTSPGVTYAAVDSSTNTTAAPASTTSQPSGAGRESASLLLVAIMGVVGVGLIL